MRNPIDVLKSLESKATQENYKFQRLYRNLYNPEFYLLAYQNIAKSTGSMTSGADGMTLDGMSMTRINRIIASLKDHSYQPNPARRHYIAKKSNPSKKRPLGIPSTDDKLVQEVVRMLLEAIYEPTFSEHSHGFRPGRSCHTALKEVQANFTGVNWVIEGDITACFDCFDHHVLIEILRRRIQDEHFISLMWKFLKAGYMEQWEYHRTFSGTPQGSGVSPILANIYLTELDRFMETFTTRFNRDSGKGYRLPSPEYNRVHHLIEDKVPTSAWLNFQNNGSFAHIFEGQPESKRYQWTINQVKILLSNEVYIGNFVYGRQAKVSYKSKKRIRTAPEKWTRLEGTHEAIIDKDVFDLVQQQIQKRHRSTENDTVQMFSGLLRCADCGWSMRYHQKKSGPIVYRAFNCTAYSHLGKASNCANHYIRYEAVYTCVLSRLQYWIAEAQKDEQGLLKRLLHAESREKKNSNKKVENDLKAATRRLQNIDKLFAKLYEDHILEAITERNFSMLSEKYQQEQEELNSKIAELTKLAEQDKQDSDNAQKWVSLIRQYTNLEELNAELLNTLIDKIIIHTATKDKDGNREQEIEIFYRFVGKIDA